MDEPQRTEPVEAERVPGTAETDPVEADRVEAQRVRDTAESERVEADPVPGTAETERVEAAAPRASRSKQKRVPSTAETERALGPPVHVEPSTQRFWGRVKEKDRFRLFVVSLLLIPLGALIGGAIGLVAASNLSTTFRSEAILVPSDTKAPLGQFPALAQAVFRTDAVLQSVVSTLNLDVTSRELLASGALSAQEVPTGGAVSIVALSPDPLLSRALANTAAQNLVDVMQAQDFGAVSVFSALAPGQREPTPTIAYGVFGALIGAVVGLGLSLTAKAIGWLRSAIRASREGAGIGA